MTDVMTPAARSALMSRIRGKNTTPEMCVRKLVHAMGYRYRLHKRSLPGAPDLVLPRKRKIIFVHGCFWHRHPGCRLAATPKTRAGFWKKKLDGNVERDREAISRLEAEGWAVLVVWECQTRNIKALEDLLKVFLE